MTYDFRALAKIAARAASDKKAVQPIVLDLRSTTDVAEYLVIVGAESTPQMRAIYDHIENTLEDEGIRLLRRDGRGSGRWIALDYGGIVVHVLLTEAREFYRLEQMWEEAKRVEWDDDEKSAPKRKAGRVKRRRPGR